MSLDVFFELATKDIAVCQHAVRGRILNYFDGLLEAEDI